MLPKKLKLKKEDFKRFKKGSGFYSTNLTLVVYKTHPEEKSRFSFVVAKKVSKKSVVRNKIKRQGYNIIQFVLERVVGGFSCVFFFKKGAEALPFEKLKEETLFLLGKAGILI